jgi:hypothetical protein
VKVVVDGGERRKMTSTHNEVEEVEEEDGW